MWQLPAPWQIHRNAGRLRPREPPHRIVHIVDHISGERRILRTPARAGRRCRGRHLVALLLGPAGKLVEHPVPLGLALLLMLVVQLRVVQFDVVLEVLVQVATLQQVRVTGRRNDRIAKQAAGLVHGGCGGILLIFHRWWLWWRRAVVIVPWPWSSSSGAVIISVEHVYTHSMATWHGVAQGYGTAKSTPRTPAATVIIP